MTFLLILILVILFVVLLILIFDYFYDMNYSICYFDEWEYIKNLPKIKYKDFINIYKINPKKYTLMDNHVRIYGRDIGFSFSFFDYYKYKFFIKRKSKIEEKDVRNKKKQKMLKSIILEVEKDIETYKKKSKDEIEQAREITERIMKGG